MLVRASCERCGAEPATLVTSRWHYAVIFYGRTMRTEAVLCRAHAQAQLSGDLVKTCLFGWWGVWSLPLNLLSIIPANIAQLNKVKRLAPPAPPPSAQSVGVGEEA